MLAATDFRTRSAGARSRTDTDRQRARIGVAGVDPFLYVARENVKAKSLTDPVPRDSCLR
jgi:hypothetical protein